MPDLQRIELPLWGAERGQGGEFVGVKKGLVAEAVGNKFSISI